MGSSFLSRAVYIIAYFLFEKPFKLNSIDGEHLWTLVSSLLIDFQMDLILGFDWAITWLALAVSLGLLNLHLYHSRKCFFFFFLTFLFSFLNPPLLWPASFCLIKTATWCCHHHVLVVSVSTTQISGNMSKSEFSSFCCSSFKTLPSFPRVSNSHPSVYSFTKTI